VVPLEEAGCAAGERQRLQVILVLRSAGQAVLNAQLTYRTAQARLQCAFIFSFWLLHALA
jgi:hypothetical protein